MLKAIRDGAEKSLAGRRNTPDLCGILQLLGKERVLDRLDRAAARLKA